MTDPTPSGFEACYAALEAALKNAPEAQLELLAATDALYDALEGLPDLPEPAYLRARMLLSQAEAVLTRYFGM